MKKLSHLLILFLLLTQTSCYSIAPSTPRPEAPSVEEDVDAQRSILVMDELQIIHRLAAYLREQGEEPNFNETYMKLHYDLEEPAVLAVTGGDIIEYGGDFLEIRLYQNPEETDEPCQECRVIYMADDGKILGYNVLNDIP